MVTPEHYSVKAATKVHLTSRGKNNNRFPMLSITGLLGSTLLQPEDTGFYGSWLST